jgi:hypothetical protein
VLLVEDDEDDYLITREMLTRRAGHAGVIGELEPG